MKRQKEKILVGKVDLSEHRQGWFRCINREGEVFVWRNKPYTDEEKVLIEKEKQAKVEQKRRDAVAKMTKKGIKEAIGTNETAVEYRLRCHRILKEKRVDFKLEKSKEREQERRGRLEKLKKEIEQKLVAR